MDEIAPYLSSDYGDESFKYYLSKSLFEFYRNLTNIRDESTEIEIEIIAKRDTVSKSISLGYPPLKDINERIKEDKKKSKKKSAKKKSKKKPAKKKSKKKPVKKKSKKKSAKKKPVKKK